MRRPNNLDVVGDEICETVAYQPWGMGMQVKLGLLNAQQCEVATFTYFV